MSTRVVRNGWPDVQVVRVAVAERQDTFGRRLVRMEWMSRTVLCGFDVLDSEWNVVVMADAMRAVVLNAMLSL